MTEMLPSQKTPSKWQQHFTLDLPKIRKEGAVWVHACSVGEVGSVASLIEKLVAEGKYVHLTVVTRTGYAHAKRLFGETITQSWLPWDLPGLMRRFVKHLQPSLLLLCETEFWPGMLKACDTNKVPVVGINTRISDRSFPKYHASRTFWKRWLSPISLFLAQSPLDAERLQAIGIPAEKVKAVGNLKFAIKAPVVNSTELRQQLDSSMKRPILIIASTHHNEEEQLLPLIRHWQTVTSDLLTLIVPRHPERFDDVADLLQQNGVSFTRYAEQRTGSESVILVDAMGILTKLYTIADLVFIGGSLAPIGGHNPLEAAVCGRGVVTGPHVQNFRAVMADMQKQGAAIVVQDSAELKRAISRLLQKPDELTQLHGEATLFMQNQHQVLDAMWQEIEPFLNPHA